MAGQLNIKMFYVALGVIAVAGTVSIVLASRGGGEATVQTLDAPFSLETAAFPGYVIGSDSAPVEIVEYVDFTCGACATFTILHGPTIKSRLVETGRARLRFRGFALHPESLIPLNAAACVGEQGMFWEMHDSLMFNQAEWMGRIDWPESRRTLRLFRRYARGIGVDLEGYDACVDENRYYDRIVATRNEIAGLGIESTPTFEVGQVRSSSTRVTYDSLRALVERASGNTP